MRQAGRPIVSALHPADIDGQFSPDVLARLLRGASIVEGLRELLRQKSDQHAKHDDRDLAHKRPPAMQWLRKVKKHEACPRAGASRSMNSGECLHPRNSHVADALLGLARV